MCAARTYTGPGSNAQGPCYGQGVAKESLKDKVLVVDDDPSFHRFVESVLTPTGLACVCVRTGEKALAMAEESCPKGLILDGLLPGVRGDEVALRLRKYYPREKLPIIFVSAFFRDLKSRLHLTSKCQVDVVLHKPLSADELRAALARVPSLAPVGLPMLVEPHQELDLDIDMDVDMSAAVELLADYLARANERVRAMQEALASLGGENQGPALEVLRAEAHRFHGSGATFGLPELTRLGGQLERVLQGVTGKVPPATHARLTGLLEALATKVERSGAQAPVPTHGEERPLRALLLDGPGELAVSCAEAGGVLVCAEVKDVLETVKEQAPDLVFVAGDRPGFDSLGAVEALSAAGVRPLVFMSRRAGLSDRLEALRRGAQGYSHPLPDAAALLRAARQLLGTRLGFSVVAFDPDPIALEELAQTLAPHQLTVTPCTRPEELFPTLRQTAPSLVVLRVEPGPEGGLELLGALKADVLLRSIPALVVSSEQSLRVEVLEAGADGFLPRQSATQLAGLRARSLAERWAAQTQATGIDPLTGTYSEAYLRKACERALKLARRGRPLALLVFEASVVGLSTETGSLALEETLAALGGRLRRSFRETDVVAHLGEGRFAALLHDVNKEDSARLLQQCLVGLSGSDLSSAVLTKVRGGFATFPEVSGGLEALLAAARAALH